MDFIQTSNKAVDKFGAGKHGFSAGVSGTGTLATFLSNTWCDGVQQELINVIEAAGIAASGATLTQVRQAIKRLAGINVRTITAAGPTVLTADDAGLVVLDATANNVAITLPAVNAVAGVPLQYAFVRADATANTVTVTRAGADTFLGGATNFTLSGQGDFRTIAGESVSKWTTTSVTGVVFATNAEAQALALTTKALSPATLAAALQGSNQSLATSGYQKLPGGLILQWGAYACAGVHSTSYSPTFPIAFPTACYLVQATPGPTIATASTVSYTPLVSKTTTGFTFEFGLVGGGTYASTVNFIALGK